jgi:hypothetical protein
MSTVYVLEWKFLPPDYFESPIEIRQDDYTMIIADGKIEAKIDSAVYESNPSMRYELHDELNSRFLGAQLLNDKEYELSRSAKTRLHPDGRKDIFLEVEPITIKVAVQPVDFLVSREGKVVTDTKRDRIEKRKMLADLAAKHRRDKVLATILQSYDASKRDRKNELVHLFEILEALRLKLGGDKGVHSLLKIHDSDLDRLAILCNEEPLRQGRHRGKKYENLRDATKDELNDARKISADIIEAYLTYLESAASQTTAQ